VLGKKRGGECEKVKVEVEIEVEVKEMHRVQA
jgi:hypothetical protein